MSIVDVVAVLTESPNQQVYWRVLKKRLKDEENETVTNCNGLKMLAADVKMRMTDEADTEQLFRLIQYFPSPKAEPLNYGWHSSNRKIGRNARSGVENRQRIGAVLKIRLF